jgi:hypothetical protein
MTAVQNPPVFHQPGCGAMGRTQTTTPLQHRPPRRRHAGLMLEMTWMLAILRFLPVPRQRKGE